MTLAAPDSPTRPVALIPAALVSGAAVFLFWIMWDAPGYLMLAAGVAGGFLTDRHGWSRRLGPDLLLIALALLFFNMRKHLRKADYPDLPTSAEVREQQARDAAQQGAGGDQR